MHSARRQRRSDYLRSKNKSGSGHNQSRSAFRISKVLLMLIIFAICFLLFIYTRSENWNGKDKVTLIYPDGSENINVIVLDPMLGEQTTLIIPGDTEINVARGYGTYRIKNLWKLGMDEKLGGDLLAESVTRTFLFPTILWTETDIKDYWKFIFAPGSTNIHLGDRIKMAFFALKVKSLDKTHIDLAKNQFLKKQTLTDGEEGYVFAGPISSRLTVYFSDNMFSNQNEKFSLVDSSGKNSISDSVGAVLEVMGGKVVSVERRAQDDRDCEVLGQNKDAVQKVANLFSCKKVTGKSDYDLEMRYGSSFAKRF